MNLQGIQIPIRHSPVLDKGFIPLSLFFARHQQLAKKPFAVAVERTGGHITVYDTKIIGEQAYAKADRYYVDRLVKFLLWSRGGFCVTLCGDKALGKAVAQAYTDTGERAFDKGFMERVYGRPFAVRLRGYEERPVENEISKPIGRHLDGCRIGFDAGGSDRKVSAVIDGEPVYSEEVVWFPKEKSNPQYHYDGIMEALRTAAAKMPRVDAIGVSSAGVFIDNRCKVASLFLKVSPQDFKTQAEDIYLRAAKEMGNIPIVVANDGDVTALAGAMSIRKNGVLGIAMGTSEAAGYVNTAGNITGWLNELAFAPVDGQPDAMRDEWSGDIGCGVKYLSQDGVIKLAGNAGIPLAGANPAEKLKEVQALLEKGDARAEAVYRSAGVYFGHTLALYSMFYEIRHVLIMGRVMSGRGGDILLEETLRVLREEYPHLAFSAGAPDEKARRVGQSVAAASLPKLCD
ncbi:MAG: ROK family protein [Clostridiales bacterium]|jgi:predicted NBD/HSP70 family sugar kinase|nr:ROK family protein [Clostridiales bacterium]